MTETSPTLTRAEAARLNGAKSRGPRTPEGKARSARNALKHGLTAQAFALLPGEDAEAYAALLADLTRRYRPADALAAHLVQRLASVMWRQQRADRLEAEVLEQRDYAGANLYAPLVWDAARFSAVQRHQARLDRTLFRLLDELERHPPAPDETQAEDDQELPNEPDEAPAPAAAMAVEPPPARPEPVPLPLTPELEALLDENTEESWKAFVAGRCRQLRAARGEAGG